MVILGGANAWGQAQNSASVSATKVDKATAYYHFMLAHLYSEFADASGTTNSEYEKKVTENYKAAVKADPETPHPRLLALPFSPIYIPRLPASRQGR